MYPEQIVKPKKAVLTGKRFTELKIIEETGKPVGEMVLQ